jgi:endo-1,4-beta-xylanase
MKRTIIVIAGCVAALALFGSPGSAHARTGPVQLGAAVGTGPFMSDPDPRYRATLAASYDSITAETAMKIQDLQPQRGQFDFTVADAMVAFAEQHGQQVFGHTLSWCLDSTMPGWLRNGSWSRASLLAVLEQHITAVMAHFRGRVAAWDVVNEALNDDGTRRNCLWKRVIGDDWIEQAFRIARQADPGAKLFYNETHADVPNPKYEATLSLIRDLRARGVPVDGVGLQYHLTNAMPTRAQVDEAIGRLGELGLEVHISELDVPVWYLGSTLERKLARQAAVYGRIGAACQAQPACSRITTWGFMDRYTWRQPWNESLPLPFDTEYMPKPAWQAIQAALNPTAPPPPPPPSEAPPTPPVEEPAGQPTVAATAVQPPPGQAATAATGQPLSLQARLRRQRLRTWLTRRALIVLLRVGGAETARVQLVARVRGRTIGGTTTDLAAGPRRPVRMSLTGSAGRRLRDAGRAHVVLTAIATAPDGRMTVATTRVHVRQ